MVVPSYVIISRLERGPIVVFFVSGALTAVLDYSTVRAWISFLTHRISLGVSGSTLTCGAFDSSASEWCVRH